MSKDIKLKQVVGIVRCSGKDGDSTLERQEALIRDYCQHNKLAPPTILIDRHKSGFKASRKALVELKNLISRDQVSDVIFVSLDRLIRNVRVGLELVDLFQSKNIQFISLTENLAVKDAASKFQLQMYLSMAENFRNQISDKMRTMIKYKRENNLKCAGHTPYGYDAVNGKLIPNLPEQSVIDEMIRLRDIENLSYSKIAQVLTDKKYPTRTNRANWDGRTIQNIIKRELAKQANKAA